MNARSAKLSPWQKFKRAFHNWQATPDPLWEQLRHIPTVLLDARWRDKIREQYRVSVEGNQAIYTYYWAETSPPATSPAQTAYDSVILEFELSHEHPYFFITPREAPWLSSIDIPCHLPGVVRMKLGKDLDRQYYAYCFEGTEDVALSHVVNLSNKLDWNERISIEVFDYKMYVCKRVAIGRFHAYERNEKHNYVNPPALVALRYIESVRYAKEQNRTVHEIAQAALEMREDRYQWRCSQF